MMLLLEEWMPESGKIVFFTRKEDRIRSNTDNSNKALFILFIMPTATIE
ncbi:hypothetical protein [Kistimonas scapharcae]